MRRFAILLAASLAQPIAAQSVITVRPGAGGRIQVTPGATVSVPVVIDMTAAGGTNLGALSTGLSWGASRLTFDSVTVAGFGTLTANTSGAAGGALNLAVTSASGTTSTVTMANAFFTASTSPGGTSVTVGPTGAGDNNGVDILPLVRIRRLEVCIAAPGNWGDANNDVVVNIIDAQQIARFSVGLTVASPILTAAQGDVTNDGNVNIIDAQQIARFSVGLSAAARINTVVFTPPVVSALTVSSVFDATAGSVNAGVPANLGGVPVGGQAQIQPLARDASSVDVTSCATTTYSSNNAAVATVSASGLIDAVSPGSATITVASGSSNSSVNVTVSTSVALVANSWTNAAGGLWSVPGNWSLGRIPTATDSVVIAQAGTYTVTMDVNFSGAYVAVGGASGTQTLSMSSRTLALTGGVTVKPSAVFFVTSSTLNSRVTNQGLLIAEGTSAITGALTTAAGAILRVEGNGFCCNTQLTVASGFTNNGAIELTSVNGAISATLTVTAGTLLNPAGSTITALAGTGGARTLAAQVDNQGTLDLFPSAAGTLTINGSLTSSGIINMELGGTTAGSTYDLLNVTSGPATISGGTLNVTLINGFTPSNGQNFTILTSSAPRSGTFATANRPANTSMQYNPNSVVVTAP